MQPKVNKYLVVVAGPTGVGKTQTAIDLASRFKTCVVSADSRQIYREMNIGTAKPDPDQLARVPHYFINNVSLNEIYSAGHYARDSLKLLEGLFERHDIIILAGGSGLYIRGVTEGFDEMPDVPQVIKVKWASAFAEKGLMFLQQELKRLDPKYASEVDLQNAHRLIRALSVSDSAGKPFSELRKKNTIERPFQLIKLLCNLPRQELYDRIHQRVDDMIARGLVEEVQSLLPYRHTQAMQTVGYREIIAHLDGLCTLEEAIAKVKQHTCNYAKRQLTWYRHQGDWKEFNPPDVEKMVDFIRNAIRN